MTFTAEEKLAIALAKLQQACPCFAPSSDLAPTFSLKCALVPGEYQGAPAYAKVLINEAPIWRFYLEREILLYQLFAEQGGPDLRRPQLHFANAAAFVLVEERLLGETLCPSRQAHAPLGPALVTKLLAARRALAAFQAPAALAMLERPKPSLLGLMRKRLLEDPGDGLAFVVDGISYARDLDILDRNAARLLRKTMLASPKLAFSHGDFLLRNLFQTTTGEVAVLDWETAGLYPEGWDLALLWASLHPGDRPLVEAEAEAEAKASEPKAFDAFLACVAFALAREIKFSMTSQTRAAPSARSRALSDDLERIVQALRSARA